MSVALNQRIWNFFKVRKKWWLPPILIFALVVGLAVLAFHAPKLIHWVKYPVNMCGPF